MNRDLTEQTIHRQDKTVRWDGEPHSEGSSNGSGGDSDSDPRLSADETQLVSSEKPVSRSPHICFALLLECKQRPARILG